MYSGKLVELFGFLKTIRLYNRCLLTIWLNFYNTMPHFSMSGNHQLNKKSQVVSPTARNEDAQAGTHVLSSWKRTCLSYQSIGTLTLLKEKVVERVIFSPQTHLKWGCVLTYRNLCPPC